MRPVPNRTTLTATLLPLLALLLPAEAEAQRSMERFEAPPALASVPIDGHDGEAGGRRLSHRGRMVVGGAIAGTVGGAVFYYYQTRDMNDGDFLFPLTLLTISGAGAIAGGVIGYVASFVVPEEWTRPRDPFADFDDD